MIGDKTWVFETTRRQIAKKFRMAHPGIKSPKKATLRKSKMKTMLIVFFDAEDMGPKEFVLHTENAAERCPPPGRSTKSRTALHVASFRFHGKKSYRR